jgi:hypothetical protein
LAGIGLLTSKLKLFSLFGRAAVGPAPGRHPLGRVDIEAPRRLPHVHHDAADQEFREKSG